VGTGGRALGTFVTWEQGRRVPSFTYAILIARALGVTLDELAGEDEPPAPRRRKGGRKRK
jgi:hypothetical protein